MICKQDLILERRLEAHLLLLQESDALAQVVALIQQLADMRSEEAADNTSVSIHQLSVSGRKFRESSGARQQIVCKKQTKSFKFKSQTRT